MKRTLFLLAGFALAVAASAQTARLGRYALVLKDPPVAARIASRAELGSPAARNAVRAIQARQAVLRAELQRRGFRVTGSVHTLLNAVFVQGSPQDRKRLTGLADVRLTAYMPPVKRQLNAALDLINAPGAWANLSGGQANAGAGVRIAILDTGIDQTHPAFQEACANPPATSICGGDDCAFTNGKVIAARSYVRFVSEGYTDPPELTSRPDDLSPRDRDGHGTALAMIAAGNPVNAPGGTISGVAPKACLGNYKVFGSPGVNDWAAIDGIITALENALYDGMQIASLSLGSPARFGPLDTGDTVECGAGPGQFCDPEIETVENAISMGMTVVIAAGNSGDTAIGKDWAYVQSLNSITSPGTAPSAITVGASTNSHIWSQSVHVVGDNVPADLQTIPGRFGNGPKPAAVTDPYPLRDVSTFADAEACSALPAASLTGAIAIVKRGTCYFSDKVTNAQNAGALAVIIHLNTGEAMFNPVGLENTAIPAFFISYENGAAIKEFVNANPNSTATLDPTLQSSPVSTADHVAALSSRGPAIGTFGIKPDVVAVGTSVYSATQNYDPNGAMYDRSRYTAADGTSFSTPMVAGVAALVKQKNPTFTPAQIKSAIVNTADPITVDTQLGILQQGAGRVDAAKAVQTNITVAPATVSFGNMTGQTVPKQVDLAVYAAPGVDWSANVQPVVTGGALSTERTSTGLRVTLGSVPSTAGVYYGAIVISGGAVPVRVPYAFFISDNVPNAIVPMLGDGFDWLVNSPVYYCSPDPNESWGIPSLMFKAVDRFGVPVTTTGSALNWEPLTEGAQLRCEGTGASRVCYVDGNTDKYGIGGACVITSPTPGEQIYRASLNYNGTTLNYDFYGYARLPLTINPNGIVDAASNTVNPNVGLVPGSLISIYGEVLGDTYAWAMPVPDQPLSLPIALAGLSVSFDAGGISLPGRLLYAGPKQVNVQIPWELQGQSSAVMKVSIGDFSTPVYTQKLATGAAPQLFQYASDTDMTGFAVAQDEEWNLIDRARPAQPGQWVTLWGNAFGPVNGQPHTGEPAGEFMTLQTTPTVTVGGKPVMELDAGLHPYWVGLYQLNIRLPDDTPAGAQPIVVNIGNVASQPAYIMVQ